MRENPLRKVFDNTLAQKRQTNYVTDTQALKSSELWENSFKFKFSYSYSPVKTLIRLDSNQSVRLILLIIVRDRWTMV